MGEYNDILAIDKEEFEREYMTTFDRRYNPMDKPMNNSKAVVEKIQRLNLKKGDVLLITVSDDRGELPRQVFDKLNFKICQSIQERIKKIYEDSVQIIFIPSSMDVSVLRLEEWFV